MTMTIAIPENEEERLRVLYELAVLDTPPDPEISGICDEIARTFAVPMAAVSLIDRDRQWCKALVGLEACEIHRADAFCSQTILQDESLVVNDALSDARFRTHPLVLGRPWIRFYAGAPLFFGQDIRLGAVCILDTAPRPFGPDQIARLEQFAERVLGCLWRHDIEVNGSRYELGDIAQGNPAGGDVP